MRKVLTAAAEKALSWFRVKCKRVTLTGHSSWTPPPMPDIVETKMQENTISFWEIGEICRDCASKRHSLAVLLIMSDRQAVVSGESTVYHPGWRHLGSVSFRKAFLNFGRYFLWTFLTFDYCFSSRLGLGSWCWGLALVRRVEGDAEEQQQDPVHPDSSLFDSIHLVET